MYTIVIEILSLALPVPRRQQ